MYTRVYSNRRLIFMFTKRTGIRGTCVRLFRILIPRSAARIIARLFPSGLIKSLSIAVPVRRMIFFFVFSYILRNMRAFEIRGNDVTRVSLVPHAAVTNYLRINGIRPTVEYCKTVYTYTKVCTTRFRPKELSLLL